MTLRVAPTCSLSLHAALPISAPASAATSQPAPGEAMSAETFAGLKFRSVGAANVSPDMASPGDRKSTRLNSSHRTVCYAVVFVYHTIGKLLLAFDTDPRAERP